MIQKELLERVLEKALSTGGDFAEIFVEDRWDNSITLIGGKIENSLSGRDFGVGIRIIKDLFDVYAYTNDSSENSLLTLAQEVASAIEGTPTTKYISLEKKAIKNFNKIEIIPNSISKDKKIAYMKIADRYASDYSPLISQVKVIYGDYTQKILIANSHGELIED
ncbi:MAG: PmbA/TldA family metallopeptidase, partial [Fusobacteriaceae bacterium]